MMHLRACPVIIFVIIIITVTAVAVAEENGTKSGEAEVTADKLHVDHAKRVAKFEGNVRARFGKLTLTCRQMSLVYDDAGEVRQLSATGQVTVIRDDLRATADNVRLDSKTGGLVLEGHPVLVKGPHRLTGRRIEVDLATGQVEVLEARGEFRLSRGKP